MSEDRKDDREDDRTESRKDDRKVTKSEAEWRQCLTPEQFQVLRQQGTERAFTGAYWDSHEPARYLCAGCGQELFASDDKYDSGSGWPSFTSPTAPQAVETVTDRSHGMVRTEVRCSRCGGHLGHVFPDGPGPNGLRYCINSVALEQKADRDPEDPPTGACGDL